MTFDLVISNAYIYDGAGRSPYRNDVGVIDGRIAAIGDLSKAQAGTRIDATGRALCPGFIDIHSHADKAIHRPNYTSLVEPLVRQGITTFVGGNCGTAMGPISKRNTDTQMSFYDFFIGGDQSEYVRWQSFGELMDVYEETGLVLNTAMLAPHSILRMDELDISTARATPQNIRGMKESLTECLEAGAIGMSAGLQYPAGLSSDQWELTELARTVHDYNGVFTAHLRSYSSDTLQNAIDEVLTVGRDAEVPVEISHLFWIPNFPRPLNQISNKAIKGISYLYNKKPFPVPIDSALGPFLDYVQKKIDGGQPIGIDAMPTSAGFTHVLAFFPPWSLEGGIAKVKERLADPEARKQIRYSIEHGDTAWPHRGRDSWSMNLFKVMGWDCAFIMSVSSEKNQHLAGRSFADIGKETGRHPFDVVCDLLLEENGRVLIFETVTYPGDPLVEQSLLGPLTHKSVSIVTDTIPLNFGLPSHLTYDCFPKFLGHYSRDLGKISMSEAIRKCTSLPASKVQLRQRGQIREGYFADMVIFDPANIGSRSTATDPAHFPAGIEYVFINGHATVDPDGYHPEARKGTLIRH